MTWSIRRMNESDIEIVYAIEMDAHIAPWGKNILRDCVLVGYDCLVLEITVDHHKVLAGYMISRRSHDHYHILNLCIAKNLQSKGYGFQFLQSVLETLGQSREIEYVMLEVRPSNKSALHLYDLLGFKLAEIKQGYYKDSEPVEDAILLKKMLHV